MNSNIIAMMKVVIVGMGLIGRILALSLLRRIPNVQLRLIDQVESLAVNAGCGAVSAGMVAPFSEFDSTKLGLSLLGQESLKLWPELLAGLPTNGIFKQNGTLILAHHRDEADFKQLSKRLTEYFPPQQAKLLSCKALETLEPDLQLQQFHQEIIHLPLEANLNVPKFYAATAEFLAVSSQCDYLQQEILDLQPGMPLLEDMDYIMDTRGLGAKCNLKNLYGIRGEALLVDAPEVNLQQTIRLIHPRHALYIVPRDDSLYYIGATTVGGQDDSAISVKSILDLTSALYTVHSGFLEARIVKTFSHSRPSFPSSMPKINKEANIISLNGFYRHGHLLGPALCQQVVKQLLNEEYINDKYCA